MEYHPRAPFSAWPQQWVHPAYGYGWISTGPMYLVTQSMPPTATIEAVEVFNDYVDEVVATIGADRARNAIVIHDWRSVREIGPAVRKAWLERVKRRPPDFPRAANSYIALSTSSLMRMTLQVASLAHQLATGQPPTRIVSDPAEPLREHGLLPPSPVRDSVGPIARR